MGGCIHINLPAWKRVTLTRLTALIPSVLSVSTCVGKISAHQRARQHSMPHSMIFSTRGRISNFHGHSFLCCTLDPNDPFWDAFVPVPFTLASRVCFAPLLSLSISMQSSNGSLRTIG